MRRTHRRVSAGLVPSTGNARRLALVFSSMGSYTGYTFFYCAFVAVARKVATQPTGGSSAPYLDLVLVLTVFCALVTPTVLLETTTAGWVPGSRARMVQQGFQPVFYLSILFLLTEFLFRR